MKFNKLQAFTRDSKSLSSPDKGIEGFTLVELIVVVTILAILGTIGFVSYSSYLTGVRDANRTAQLESISSGLHLYSTTKPLPNPDDAITITGSGGSTVGYQGYAGTTLLETIDYSKEGLDPKDKNHFTYYLSGNKKHHQLLAFLEESSNLQAFNTLTNPLIPQTYAADLTGRYPTVYGKKLGVLIDTATNNPAQDAGVDIDITDTGVIEYTAMFSDSSQLTGSSTDLAALEGLSKAGGLASSCKILLDRNSSLAGEDGVYMIDPEGGNPFGVYCDMTTDGGGFTYATMLADTTTQNLFYTTNTTKITSLDSDISTKGQISDIWRDSSNKDLLLVCSTTNAIMKNYEIPTIIYSYKKSDIGHLEKQAKGNTTFSSTNLQAKWNNSNFTILNNYGGSNASQQRVYLYADSPVKAVFIFAEAAFYSNSTYRIPSAAGINSGSLTSTTISTTNYCMSAIR